MYRVQNQENLETLLTDTEAMRGEASVFHRSAVRAKDKMWWKNFKLMCAIILLAALLAGVITASVFFNKKGSSSSGGASGGGGATPK